MEFASTLRHRNIVRFFGASVIEGRVIIIMELAKMSLKQFAEEWKEFSLKDVECIAFRLMWGLNYIHSKNIVHRDVKVMSFHPSSFRVFHNNISFGKYCFILKLQNCCQYHFSR